MEKLDEMREEIRQGNEDRQVALDRENNRRVRQIQFELAEDVEAARTVPAALKALDKECRAAAREAVETLALVDLSVMTPLQGEKIDAVRRRLRHVLSLLDDGGARAARAVAKVDGLTFQEVKPWSPIEFARNLRSDLQSAASAPQTIKTIIQAVPLDMDEIRRMLKTGPRLDPQGAGSVTEREPERQTVAHSNTQGT